MSAAQAVAALQSKLVMPILCPFIQRLKQSSAVSDTPANDQTTTMFQVIIDVFQSFCQASTQEFFLQPWGILSSFDISPQPP